MTTVFLCLLFPVFVALQVQYHIGFINFNAPVPAFLSGMSLKAQYDYKVILENDTLASRTKNSHFKTWANTYNVTTQYNQFSAQQNATRTQFEKNVTQVISQLSSVNLLVSKILDNDTLSVQDQRSAVEELAEQQYPQEVAALLSIRRLIDPQDALSVPRKRSNR